MDHDTFYIKYNLVEVKIYSARVCSEYPVGPASESGTHEEGKEGPESRQEFWVRADRGAVLVLKESECVLVNLGSVVCVLHL